MDPDGRRGQESESRLAGLLIEEPARRPGTPPVLPRGRTPRVIIGCLGIAILLIASPYLLVLPFVIADKVAFELNGGCIGAPMTSDACRGSYGFDVLNRTSEIVDVVAIRPGGLEASVVRGVAPGTVGLNDSFEVKGGKCEPALHLIARTPEGRVVAERTGICRREDWVITEGSGLVASPSPP